MLVQKPLKCKLSDEHVSKIQEMLQLKVDILQALISKSATIHEVQQLKGTYAKTKGEKIETGFGYYFALEETPNIINEELPEYTEYAKQGYSRLLYSIAVDFRDLMSKGIKQVKSKKNETPIGDIIVRLGALIPDLTYVKLHTRSNGVYVKENNLHIPEYKLVIPIAGYEECKFKTYLRNVFINWPNTSTKPIIFTEVNEEVNY